MDAGQYLFERGGAQIDLRKKDQSDMETLGLTALKVIGKGTFAVVFHARDRAGRTCAVKKVYCPKELLPQKNFLLGLPDHPHVVKLLGFFEQPDAVGGGRVVFELYERYDLNLEQVIRCLRARKRAFPPNLLRHVCQCLLQALDHLHTHRIIHRDVKPANVLLRFGGGLAEPESAICYEDTRAEEVEVVLADLGLAVSADQPRSTTYVCTRYYRAPELLFGYMRYIESVDVWAMGCLIAELVRLRPLFRGDKPAAVLAKIFSTLGAPSPATLERYTGLTEPVAAVQPCGLESRVPGAGKALLELLLQMLCLDDLQRLSARAALELHRRANA